MTAASVPNTMPIAIDRMVSLMVIHTPRRMMLLKRYLRTVGHSRFGLVNSMCTSIATSTAITAIATHRQGCRTGTARMFSGRPVTTLSGGATEASPPDVMSGSTGRAVDRRCRDRARVVAVLVEDRLVPAVRAPRGQRGLDGGCEPRALRNSDAIRGGLVDLGRELDLAGGLLEGVCRDRGVRRANVCSTTRQREVGAVLVVGRETCDGLLSGVRALLGERRDLALLGGALLDGDGQAAQAQVGPGDALRGAGSAHQRLAGIEVVDEVDRRFASFRV